MRFSNSRSLLAMVVTLSLSACSTTTSSDVSAPALAAPLPPALATPSPPDVEPAAPPAPKLVPAPAKIPDVPVEITSPQVPKAIPTRKLSLECTQGTKVTGQVDRWSPLSSCPTGYQVTGLGRIDLQGDHNRPNLHVNDFICDDRGCKAWCIGDGCTVEARCCRIIDQGPP